MISLSQEELANRLRIIAAKCYEYNRANNPGPDNMKQHLESLIIDLFNLTDVSHLFPSVVA